MIGENFIRAFWYMSNNVGDNLNYYLIKKLSGKEPVYTDVRSEKHFIICGSILSEAQYSTTVWGAGFGDHTQRVSDRARVLAVRGHLSSGNITQPVPYIGDPALLMSKIYNPSVDKKHEHGVIPHWKDLEKLLFLNQKYLKIISPLQPVEEFIQEMLSCRSILSTSLHGLILADTYNIPNKWLDLGSGIGGDDFKFKDYYSTTDTPEEEAINRINFSSCSIHYYKHSLNDFLTSCPFYNNSL